MALASPLNNVPLSLLFVTGDIHAAARLADYLGAATTPLSQHYVSGLSGLRAAVRHQRWDAVLYFHGSAGLSVASALKQIHEQGLDLPFIIIAAPEEEKAAIRAMKAGAHDVVSLDRLDRLLPAIEREAREAHHRSDHRAALEMLRDSETRFRTLASNLPGMVFHLQREAHGAFRFVFVSEGCQQLLGIQQQEVLASADRFFEVFKSEDRHSLLDALHRSGTTCSPLSWEGRVRGRWIDLRSVPRRLEGGSVVWQGIAANITGTKEIEAELRASREQLAELSFHLEAVREEERERIARDIHDELGSILVRLKIEATLLSTKLGDASPAMREKALSIEHLLDQAIGTTQRVARQLRPGILNEFGLAEAIRCQSEDFAQSTGITCRAQCDDGAEAEAETSLALFRIVQEALTNVAKHAHASLVVIRLRREPGFMSLEIRDNGRGISDADMNKTKSFGLRGIRERVHSLSGEFDISTAEQGGTHLSLKIPVPRIAIPTAADENIQGALF